MLKLRFDRYITELTRQQWKQRDKPRDRANFLSGRTFCGQPVPGSKTVGPAELRKREHENKTGGNWGEKGRLPSFFLFFPAPPTFRVRSQSSLPESLERAILREAYMMFTGHFEGSLHDALPTNYPTWRRLWKFNLPHQKMYPILFWQVLVPVEAYLWLFILSSS